MTQSKTITLLTLAATVIIGAGCRKEPPAVESKATIATTQWIDRKFGFVADYEVNKTMNRIVKRLGEAVSKTAHESGATSDEMKAFQKFPWQAFVINSAQPNAFSTGGGVIFVTRGLFRELPNEAEFAAVIAHEMAHELLGHTKALTDGQERGSSPQLRFSLENEIQADAVSMALLHAAQYNIREALNAVTDMYRARLKAGSEVNEAWIGERLTSLQRKLMTLTPSTTSTTNTREYLAIREKLLGNVPTTK